MNTCDILSQFMDSQMETTLQTDKIVPSIFIEKKVEAQRDN